MARKENGVAETSTAGKAGSDSLLLGGMARWDGLDLFGPHYMSTAYRKKSGEIFIRIDPVKVWKPQNPLLRRASGWPIIRSFFFWGQLLVQVGGSVWTLAYFVGSIAALWLLVRALELGSGLGSLGGFLGFLADFPMLPLLVLFFAAMKLTSIGRYHGAEHKAVAAYEKYGEVTMEKARVSSRIHPRCGTNILIYIIIAAALEPLIPWWWYSIAQFILISELWFAFGQSRPSIAVGNFLQRYFTTSEPTRRELEVAVASINRLLEAEGGSPDTRIGTRMRMSARY